VAQDAIITFAANIRESPSGNKMLRLLCRDFILLCNAFEELGAQAGLNLMGDPSFIDKLNLYDTNGNPTLISPSLLISFCQLL